MKNRDYIEQLANDLRRHIELCRAWKESAQKRLEHLEYRAILKPEYAPEDVALTPKDLQEFAREAFKSCQLPPTTPAPPPRPWHVGDVVRLEAYPDFYDEANYVGMEGKILRFGEGVEKHLAVTDIPCKFMHGNMWWPTSCLTLIRPAAPVDEAADLRAENARLLAELEELRSKLDSRTQDRNVYAQCCAIKDADIARLDGDVERLTGLWNIAVRQRDEFQCDLDNERSALAVRTRQRNQAEAERDTLRGAMAAQDSRERAAGEKCGVPYELHGCDWPDAVAEEVMVVRRERDAAIADRDALRARIDGGTVVFRHDQSAWWPGQSGADTRQALLIDVQTIAPTDIAPIAEESSLPDGTPCYIHADGAPRLCRRKVERRVVVPEYITQDGRDYAMDHDAPWIPNKRKSDRRKPLSAPANVPDHIADAGDVDERKGEEIVNSSGVQYKGHWLPFHDRRRTPGTIADRKEAS